MKSEKGITLISLIIYIIAVVIIISIITVITTFFYKNVNNVGISINPINEYTKFNSYFTDEVNKENIKVLECKQNESESYIVFDNGVQYTFIKENKGIYKNTVKICKNVTKCTFSNNTENGNDTITVQITIGDKNYTNTYTLKK